MNGDRFETLQSTTSIHQQSLLSPIIVDTLASEDQIIKDNIEIFKANGFNIVYDESADPGKRVKITSFPFSKSVQFGISDFHELASMLCDDGDGGDEVYQNIGNGLVIRNEPIDDKNSNKNVFSKYRLPKLMAMFASRACRSAVMIGMPLHMREMTSIVNNLSILEQPWNCPHGRPTLRHLIDISPSLSNDMNIENISSFFKYSKVV